MMSRTSPSGSKTTTRSPRLPAAPGDGLGRRPRTPGPDQEPAAVSEVERAAGAGGGAMGTTAGARHARERAVVPERDALAAELGEGDAPGTQPDRPFGELEAGG